MTKQKLFTIFNNVKNKNEKQEIIFIYNIKGNKMTMNVFAHEFFAEERAAFAERAFAEFMYKPRA